jgi:hypothetical protein
MVLKLGRFGAVDQKHLESFEMWCWRRMEKIRWTDHVRNEDVLLRVEEQRNILHEICKRKANWIGHILHRNCLLQRLIDGKIQGGIEVTRRRGRRRWKLLDDLKERGGYSHLKVEALDRTMLDPDCVGLHVFSRLSAHVTEELVVSPKTGSLPHTLGWVHTCNVTAYRNTVS